MKKDCPDEKNSKSEDKLNEPKSEFLNNDVNELKSENKQKKPKSELVNNEENEPKSENKQKEPKSEVVNNEPKSENKQKSKILQDEENNNHLSSQVSVGIPLVSTNELPKENDVGRSVRSAANREFFIPGYNNNELQAKAVCVNELLDASKAVTNMALAHEIAVDEDFLLKKIKSEDSIEQRIQEMMHKAFWDILKEQLEAESPQFDQALILLAEVKTMLSSVLLSHHHNLRRNIDEVLDMELIKKQLEHGVFEFDKYAEYVLGLMEKLCAPIRDEQIEALGKIKEIVPLFRGIMEMLEVMKLDMANFSIQQARPLIISQSVEYEKKAFKKFLASCPNGLNITRDWLNRHSKPLEPSVFQEQKLAIGSRILDDAFAEILEWDETLAIPETLAMDYQRILALKQLAERVSVSTSVIILAFGYVSQSISSADAQKVKEIIKNHIDPILEDFNKDSDLPKLLPCIDNQVVEVVNDYLINKEKEKLRENVTKNLKMHINELENPKQTVRTLVKKRIVDFNKELISGPTKTEFQVTDNLNICRQDLQEIGKKLVRLVEYNKSVFEEFYNQIIEDHYDN